MYQNENQRRIPTKGSTKEKQFLSRKEASLLTGINSNTLRSLADQNKVDAYRTPPGMRKFNRRSLEKMCNLVPVTQNLSKNGKAHYLYARVSSQKQSDDIVGQIQYRCSRKPTELTFNDLQKVDSGITFKREGLQTILDAGLQGIIREIITAH